MSHLAYLGQMLEKRGRFALGVFPEGLVLLYKTCMLLTRLVKPDLSMKDY